MALTDPPKKCPNSEECARLFDEAEPNQYGNVSERIKFVIRAMEERINNHGRKPDAEFDRLRNELLAELNTVCEIDPSGGCSCSLTKEVL